MISETVLFILRTIFVVLSVISITTIYFTKNMETFYIRIGGLFWGFIIGIILGQISIYVCLYFDIVQYPPDTSSLTELKEKLNLDIQNTNAQQLSEEEQFKKDIRKRKMWMAIVFLAYYFICYATN